MKNKTIFLIGGSIIIAALILFNKEIRSIIPASTGSVAQNLKMPNDVEAKSLVTTADKVDSPPIPSTASKPKPVVPVPVDNINSLEVFSQNKLFNCLSVETNRQKILKRALQLNNGQYTNACVYFMAEALRQNGVVIPNDTCNTTGLIVQLKNKGWTRGSDYKNLRAGDICFTMDNNHGNGAPAHTYVFMAWVSPDNYDYAMVCDNQADRYGTVYHKRNIAKIDVYNGEEKEAFQFFMRK